MASYFSAGGSLAGYLWQVRHALLTLLKLDFGQSIELESKDDIVVRGNCGELLCALQAKHSLELGPITIKSVELWKTLRVWAEHFEGSTLSTQNFVLLTTDDVEPGSPLEVLVAPLTRSSIRLVQLRAELDNVAREKGNKKLDIPPFDGQLS